MPGREKTAYAGAFVGRIIYEALEKALHDMGILNLYACIGYPESDDEYLTANSADFHAHLGFVKVAAGYFRCNGLKCAENIFFDT